MMIAEAPDTYDTDRRRGGARFHPWISMWISIVMLLGGDTALTGPDEREKVANFGDLLHIFLRLL